MDAERFDALLKTLVSAASRRQALGSVLAGTLGLLDMSEAQGRRRRQRRQGRDGNDSGGKGRRKRGQRPRVRAEAVPASCFTGSPCLPGPGANLTKCDFGGTNALENINCTGCGLSEANLRGADASGANFSSANFYKACLVDADLSGAIITSGTQLSGAIFCRTRMPNGSLNNAGCGNGKTCCPTCDAEHPCSNGLVCCNGRCQTGNCCVVGDCPDRPCQTKACQNRQCVYTDQADGQPGTLCAAPRSCCSGVCCPSGQQCCAGTCTSDSSCCRPPGAPCTQDAECCAGVCLDNGFCGCFSLAAGEVPCPADCRCDQVNPGAVGACVEDIDVTPCCDVLPECNSNTDCGLTSFCDETVCGGGVCVRRCPSP